MSSENNSELETEILTLLAASRLPQSCQELYKHSKLAQDLPDLTRSVAHLRRDKRVIQTRHGETLFYAVSDFNAQEIDSSVDRLAKHIATPPDPAKVATSPKFEYELAEIGLLPADVQVNSKELFNRIEGFRPMSEKTDGRRTGTNRGQAIAIVTNRPGITRKELIAALVADGMDKAKATQTVANAAHSDVFVTRDKPGQRPGYFMPGVGEMITGNGSENEVKKGVITPVPIKPIDKSLRSCLGKYDAVLIPFFAAMEKELHANAGKGDRPGWLQMSTDECLLEIYYHLAKLQKAVRTGQVELIVENSADVANMSMMLADICSGLVSAETQEASA